MRSKKFHARPQLILNTYLFCFFRGYISVSAFIKMSDSQRSRFIKQQDAEGLLSMIGKIQRLGPMTDDHCWSLMYSFEYMQ